MQQRSIKQNYFIAPRTLILDSKNTMHSFQTHLIGIGNRRPTPRLPHQTFMHNSNVMAFWMPRSVGAIRTDCRIAQWLNQWCRTTVFIQLLACPLRSIYCSRIGKDCWECHRGAGVVELELLDRNVPQSPVVERGVH